MDAPIDTAKNERLAPDVLVLQHLIVNVLMVGEPGSSEWVLIDTGLKTSSNKILKIAQQRYGALHPPQAIILTHGHFDHVGSVQELLQHWNVPVYAHELELPYLTGQKDYLPPDPSVGGGMMAWVSPLYPRKGINLGDRVKPLPEDGTIPGMPGWRWIHTPGHTVGHISLFRDRDSVLIAGDAFTTVKQESALAVLTQRLEIHGPPAYFTPDWQKAWESVKTLEQLQPEGVFTSHGLPWSGEQFRQALQDLAHHFDQMAIPKQGKYVH